MRVNLKNNINSFYNFMIRGYNASAFLAALSVIQEPMKYNPMFFYGKTGIGKTHLLKAIVSEFQRFHKKPALYFTAEQFIKNYVFSMRNKTMESFRQSYRNNYLLAIDDIQLFAGKDYSQGELITILKEFQTQNRPIVLAASHHPNLIPALNDIFQDSCQGGLMLEIKN